ncbi:hypothetical protein ACM66B_001378 [Microbotryomycetes sp. NB124-2]
MPKASATASPSKKRVRIESESTSSKPASSSKASSTRLTKNASTTTAAAAATAAIKDKDNKDETKKSKMGIELMDLRDKAKDLNKVEKFKSKDSPKPAKSALKKRKSHEDEQEEEQDGEDEIALEEEGDESEDDEDLDFLQGFEESDDEDDGQDSSDEDEDDDEQGGDSKKPKFDANDLPQVKGKDGVQGKLEKQQQKDKADKKKKAQTGTVYLGRIPHGFYEDEMRSYFSQFGQVTRLRLSRNKKTGRSKHYAFIEFAYESVAKIVQETMDNYLLAGHILVCKVVPNDQVHPKMWIGANRKYRPVPKARQDRVKRTALKTDEQQEKIKARLLKKEQAKRKQLAELGIEYDFAGYAGKATITGAEKGQVEIAEDKGGNKKNKAKGKVVGKVKDKGTTAPVKKDSQPAKKKARKST